MILTCPECATSYFVDDSRIAQAGRAVKCTSCGARWTARPEGAAEAEEKPAPPPAPKPEPPKITPADLEVVVAVPEPAPPPVEVKPARAPRPPKARREALGKVAILAGSAVVILALVAAALIFRAQVVRLMPASGAAYAGIGLPVNTLGLVIENAHVQTTFQAGQPALVVTGTIRSLRDGLVNAPPLRVNLSNGVGKLLAAKVARPIDAGVPARAVRHFAIAIVGPPAGVQSVDVVFDTAAPQAGKPVATPAAPVALTPPVPEAKPLPPGSPDALPKDVAPLHD